MIRPSTAERLGIKLHKSSQSASQADGTSPLVVVGEVKVVLTYDNIPHQFEGLVIENLDVEILAGTPFMECNDITIRPARRVILKDGSICEYGSKTSSSRHSVRRAHVLRALPHNTTVWPGDYIELSIPHDTETL